VLHRPVEPALHCRRAWNSREHRRRVLGTQFRARGTSFEVPDTALLHLVPGMKYEDEADAHVACGERCTCGRNDYLVVVIRRGVWKGTEYVRRGLSCR